MMGIYIRGMEMPANCAEYPVNMEVCKRGYEYLIAHPKLYDQRADDCPISYVPPHGRLIDADANIATLQKCEDDPESELAKICYGYAKKVIAACPTVIGAEEGE